MSYLCETCGKTHDGWPPDLAFKRPDVVSNMDSKGRTKRVRDNDDLCIIDDERHFIRTILFIPLSGKSTRWGIGLWVEVSRHDFNRYLEVFDYDASGEKPFSGLISNHLTIFPKAFGSRVMVQPGPSSQRPTLQPSDRYSELGKVQHRGLTDQQLHDLLTTEHL